MPRPIVHAIARVRTPVTLAACGQQIAECGNSGNSSEPHLHFQLMDHRSGSLAGQVRVPPA